MWEEKSVPMVGYNCEAVSKCGAGQVRVASGNLVYNVPARTLVREKKSK
jgi:hypothetical protein